MICPKESEKRKSELISAVEKSLVLDDGTKTNLKDEIEKICVEYGCISGELGIKIEQAIRRMELDSARFCHRCGAYGAVVETRISGRTRKCTACGKRWRTREEVYHFCPPEKDILHEIVIPFSRLSEAVFMQAIADAQLVIPKIHEDMDKKTAAKYKRDERNKICALKFLANNSKLAELYAHAFGLDISWIAEAVRNSQD